MTLVSLCARHALLLLAIGLGFGCGDLLTDAATRLSRQICEEAEALRRSGQTRRTFEHRPKSMPEGIAGDYRIEFVGSVPDVRGDRLLLVGETYDGPLRYSTTSHSRGVLVERDFRAPHRKGEATLVTLERRGHEVWIIDVR
ncbi:MAG: hypothetical protein ACKVWV_17585 [Planctomycetota bacterium]